MAKNFEIINGNSPIIMSAIHDGHDIRAELYPYLNLSECERLREEDPYTRYIAEIAETKIHVNTSRFEVDMNRPRNQAVYLAAKEAWGLEAWKHPLPAKMIGTSLAIYDRFYSAVAELLWNIIETFGYFILLDIHSYNHRRKNTFEKAPEIINPEINIGTVSVNQAWRSLIQDFIYHLNHLTIGNHKPDVRENIKFRGGEFCRWINRDFGQYGCAIAIELKKVFMDEWTGRVDIHHLNEIRKAFALTLPVLRQHMELNPNIK